MGQQYIYWKDSQKETKKYKDKYSLPINFGKDQDGNWVIRDLSDIENILISGATSSGKSNFLDSVICSLADIYDSEKLKIVLIDCKIGLFHYIKLPHLLYPITERMDETLTVLKDCLNEIEKRKENKTKEPKILIVIDELADIMLNEEEAEEVIYQIAKQGAQVGVHMLLSSSKSAPKVFSPKLKEGISTRLAGAMATERDSRNLLDDKGAEELMGNGDMIYKDTSESIRVQTPFISSDTKKEVLNKQKKGNREREIIRILESTGIAYRRSPEKSCVIKEYPCLLYRYKDWVEDPSDVNIIMLAENSEQASSSFPLFFRKMLDNNYKITESFSLFCDINNGDVISIDTSFRAIRKKTLPNITEDMILESIYEGLTHTPDGYYEEYCEKMNRCMNLIEYKIFLLLNKIAPTYHMQPTSIPNLPFIIFEVFEEKKESETYFRVDIFSTNSKDCNNLLYRIIKNLLRNDYKLVYCLEYTDSGIIHLTTKFNLTGAFRLYERKKLQVHKSSRDIVLKKIPKR